MNMMADDIRKKRAEAHVNKQKKQSMNVHFAIDMATDRADKLKKDKGMKRGSKTITQRMELFMLTSGRCTHWKLYYNIRKLVGSASDMHNFVSEADKCWDKINS